MLHPTPGLQSVQGQAQGMPSICREVSGLDLELSFPMWNYFTEHHVLQLHQYGPLSLLFQPIFSQILGTNLLLKTQYIKVLQ